MNKIYVLILLVASICSCNTNTKSTLPSYSVIEDKVYDIPIKSQVSLRVYLTDSAATKQQVTALIESLSDTQLTRSMKYHSIPTHVFIYVYKSQSDYDNNSGSWVAMYEKAGTDEPGDYHYNNESLD